MTDQTTNFFDNIGEGSGAPTALLKGVGDFVHGEIVDMFERDYIPYGKDKPEVKDDGTTRKQLVVVIQTQFRNWQSVNKVPLKDHTDPKSGPKDPSEDDGRRAVYVPEKSNIQFAIGRAVAATKEPFVVGATLGVKIAELKDTGKGNPLKVHEAVYTPKPAGSGFFDGAAQEAPQQAAPVSAEQAAAQAAPAAAPAQASGNPWESPAPTSAPPF